MIHLSGSSPFYPEGFTLKQSTQPSAVSRFSLQCAILVDLCVCVCMYVRCHNLWLKAEISADISSVWGVGGLRKRSQGKRGKKDGRIKTDTRWTPLGSHSSHTSEGRQIHVNRQDTQDAVGFNRGLITDGFEQFYYRQEGEGLSWYLFSPAKLTSKSLPVVISVTPPV